MWKLRTSARSAIAAAGFLGALFCPWWVPLLAIILLALLWRAWEALLLGLLMDFVWSSAHAFPYFTIGAIVVVWILEPLRKEFLSR